MLDVKDINVYYGAIHAVRNVSLEVNAGEIVSIIGANGAGKSTILKTLVGLLRSKTGEISFEGQNISHMSPAAIVRQGIALVPEGRRVFPRLSVEDNLRMGLSYCSARTRIPGELYELFPVLKQMLHRRGGDLSGGQQQQLAIARALAPGPRLLILDEPTEGIQPSVIKDIGRVIRLLADRGTMAILLCEQYYDFAEELADDYVVMERGEVIARGKGEDMQANEVRKLVAI